MLNYRVLFGIIIIICLALSAHGQFITIISKQDFSNGIKPEIYRKSRIKSADFKHGVRLNPCLFLKDSESDQYSREYKAIGFLKNNLIIERGGYAGVSYLFASNKGCKMQKISGYPYKMVNIVVCFNEEQTTDRQDFICIYKISGSRLILLRKTALSNAQMHADGAMHVRFSKGGTHLFYTTLYSKYLAVKL